MVGSDLASGVFAREYGQLDPVIQLGFASGRLIQVAFPKTIPADAESDHDLLDTIESYLAGENVSFGDVDVAITVPTDQRAVLEATRQVPYGEEATVSQVLRMATLDPDDPDDVTLATDALRENPVPIVIPDHRVSGGPYATPGDVRSTLRAVEDLPDEL